MFLDGQGWIFVGGGFGINRYRPGMLVLAGEIWRIFRLLAVGWCGRGGGTIGLFLFPWRCLFFGLSRFL